MIFSLARGIKLLDNIVKNTNIGKSYKLGKKFTFSDGKLKYYIQVTNKHTSKPLLLIPVNISTDDTKKEIERISYEIGLFKEMVLCD